MQYSLSPEDTSLRRTDLFGRMGVLIRGVPLYSLQDDQTWLYVVPYLLIQTLFSCSVPCTVTNTNSRASSPNVSGFPPKHTEGPHLVNLELTGQRLNVIRCRNPCHFWTLGFQARFFYLIEIPRCYGGCYTLVLLFVSSRTDKRMTKGNVKSLAKLALQAFAIRKRKPLAKPIAWQGLLAKQWQGLVKNIQAFTEQYNNHTSVVYKTDCKTPIAYRPAASSR